MNHLDKKGIKRIGAIAGGVFVIGALAILLNFLQMEVNIKDIFFEWLLFSVVYVIFGYLFVRRKEMSQKKILLKQMLIPILYVTVFWDLAFLQSGTDKSNFIVYYGLISLNMTLIFLIYLFVQNRQESNALTAGKVRAYCKEHACILLLCAVFVIGCIPILTAWLNQDGAEYYSCVSKLKTWNFTDLQALQAANHHTELYIILLAIGEFLIPNHAIGVRLVCIFMAVATMIAFDAILKILFQGNHNAERKMLTVIFAFSPYLFGIIAEINTDFPLLCFFVWMVLCHLKKEYLLQAFCALLLCFSKEPGCLIYGMYMLGTIVCIVYENRKHISVMIEELTSRHMLLNFGAGILWIFYFVGIQFDLWGLKAGSAGSLTNGTGYKLNSFDVWGKYIFFRLKEMFLFNFAWVFWGIIVLGIVWIVLFRRRSICYANLKYYIPISFSLAAFLFMNTVYITYPHIRYNIFLLFVQVLFLGTAVVYTLKSKAVRRGVLLVLCGLTILSNFVTDPLTFHMFDSYSAGNGTIACPRLFYSSDGFCREFVQNDANLSQVGEGAVYNRQYLGRAACFERLFKQIDYNKKDLIVIPDIAFDTEMLYRHVLLRKTAWKEGSMYWNTRTSRTNANFFFNEGFHEEDAWNKINTVIAEEGQRLEANWFQDYDRVFYLKLPINETFDHESILQNYDIINSYEAQDNVWKFEVFEIEEQQ